MVVIMVKSTMIRNYRKFSKADFYALGFEYYGVIYMAIVEEIAPRFMRVERECSKKGGKQKLQFRLNKQYKETLIRKGAIALGNSDILKGEYNKGVQFEKAVCEFYGVEWGGKDSVPFYVSGDLTVNGLECQVKFDGAQVVLESTLENLKRGKARGQK